MQTKSKQTALICPPADPEPQGQRYAILEAESRAGIAELVNAAFATGWWAHGPTSIHVISDSTGTITRTVFYQAMVRPDWGSFLESQ